MAARRRELKSYEMLHTLGEGSYGKVKLAVHKTTGTEVAIKIVRKSCKPEFLEREVASLKILRHRRIVQLFEVLDFEDEVLLAMELAQGGDLEGYLYECGRLAEAEARRLFQQILAAVSHCHAHGVAHRDLRPENLLLDQHRNIKLADFGLCAQFSGAALLQTRCGCPEFAAPELFLHQGYSGPKADVWSLGVVLYYMVTGDLPFAGPSDEDVRKSVVKGNYYEPRYLSRQCRDLLRKMLTRDPKKRSTLDRVIQHPWVGLKNGLPASCDPYPRHLHEAATDTMVSLGFWREDIERALLENQYDEVMGTYLILVSRQRAEEEGPDPTITPKIFTPDGGHCALILEDHPQPGVPGRKPLPGQVSQKDAQKPTSTAGPDILQEDAFVPRPISGPGPLKGEASKPGVASRPGPLLREAWGPGTPQEEAPGPCTTSPGPLLRKLSEQSSTSWITPQPEVPQDQSATWLPGPQLEGDQESQSKSTSPAAQPSSTVGTPPPRSGWRRRLFRKVAPEERLDKHQPDYSASPQRSSGGCKARARAIIDRILNYCCSCARFYGKHQARVQPAPPGPPPSGHPGQEHTRGGQALERGQGCARPEGPGAA